MPSFDILTPRRVTTEAACLVRFSGWYAWLEVQPTKLVYFRYHTLGVCHGNHRYQIFQSD